MSTLAYYMPCRYGEQRKRNAYGLGRSASDSRPRSETLLTHNIEKARLRICIARACKPSVANAASGDGQGRLSNQRAAA